MDVPAWLAHATADADARELSALKPLLEALARSMQALRDADAEFGHPCRHDDDEDQ
jgi:IS5 family transposase